MRHIRIPADKYRCILCGHAMTERFMQSTSSGWACKSMKACLRRTEVEHRYELESRKDNPT